MVRASAAMFSAVVATTSFLCVSDAVASSLLSAEQQNVISHSISELKAEEERSLADGWPDAKKVAEFICRPLALDELKRSLPDADRVFLGTDDPATLKLESNERLTGSGQVRVGHGWEAFTFACSLDPESGEAKSFEVILAAS
jgi:hypothetical protein